MEVICSSGYQLVNGTCMHSLWPFTLSYFMGIVFLAVVIVFSSMAGLGGGGIAVPILIAFFDYLPKDATIVVFCCIMGTSFGNISNLLQDCVHGEPLIKYEYVFVSIPIMFTGAIVGVLLNKFLPSITVCLILFIICLATMKKTYQRFRSQYQQENQQNLSQTTRNKSTEGHQRINPFLNSRYSQVYKTLGLITLLILVLSFCRGSDKIPSLIGIQPCSFTFWAFIVGSFILIGCISYRNLLIARKWLAPQQNLNEQLLQETNKFDGHLKQVVFKSIGAGVLSGFGLGGGILLVPMYRNLGCNSLQATASCALGICITSFVNCLQGISIGVIQINQFIFFVTILSSSAYFLSRIISTELKKRNRMSYVTGAFLILIFVGAINLPISVYQKYLQNDKNLSIIFGFGSFC